MTTAIMAREATIKTAAVEVKALTISGRQVTLSVYRQLKDELLVDPKTAELRGEPWGIVNYFWGDCQKSTHLHVVWQKGDELRRSCVWDNPKAQRGYEDLVLAASDALAGWIAARILEGDPVKGFEITGRAPTDIYKSGYGAVETTLPGGHWCSAELPWQAWRLAKWEANKPRHPELGVRWNDEAGIAEKLEEAKAEHIRQVVEWFGETPRDVESNRQALQDKMAVIEQFIADWRATYARLAELDQLFIAV